MWPNVHSVLKVKIFLFMPKCVFPKSMLEYSKEIKKIFAEETATLLADKNIRKTFKDINIMAIFKNKSSLKNLVVNTKV